VKGLRRGGGNEGAGWTRGRRNRGNEGVREQKVDKTLGQWARKRGDVQKSGREEVMGAGESGTEGLR